jgi:hypothetical protein
MKYLIPSSLLLLMSSLSLCADEVAQMQSQSMSRDPSCPPPKPCCPPKQDCIPAKCAQLVGGPKGEITPNAGPCVACGADLYLTADFIYWAVREDRLALVATTGTHTTAPLKGSYIQPDFKMEPGFKVGLGILFDHDGWDVFAEYTWIRARDLTASFTVAPEMAARDILTWGFSNGGSVTGGNVSWSLHYFNAVDLELGRNFYVSRYLKLRPHFGLKGTWQKQLYSAVLNEPNDATATGSMDQFYWGVGIRAGLDAAFHFSKSFSAIGQLALSGLWGQFQPDRLNLDPALPVGDSPLAPLNVGNNFHTIRPVIEWMLGFRWETYTCDKDFHFAIDAAWELQYWPDQNQFPAYTVQTQGGALVMQGLTLKFRFDF